MAPSYEYAIIQLAPRGARGERLNVGLLVKGDGGFIDVRSTRRPEKIKAISAEYRPEDLDKLINYFKNAFLKEQEKDDYRKLRFDPLDIVSWGRFVAESHEYATRVNWLLTTFVDPMRGEKTVRPRRTRLLSEVKVELRKNRVLARPGESLESHRIVQNYVIDDAITADLLLKNGYYHVIETLDIDNQETRSIYANAALSALVFERAIQIFGLNTKNRLVYKARPEIERNVKPSLDFAEKHGAKLINIASRSDEQRFINELIQSATPYESAVGNQSRSLL